MKILIIGGVAGGASTAARLRRLDENAEIIIFERGNDISFANCGIPYYCGDVIKEREKLSIMTPEKLKNLLNIEARVNSEVLSINRDEKTITILNKITNEQYKENYDKLVLSPGAAPIKPPIDGIDDDRILTVRNLDDADKIKNLINLHQSKKVSVVGGGFIGIEMAENLAHLGIETSLIELSNQVMQPVDYEIAVQIHNHLIENGIDLHLEDGVKSFTKGEKLIVNLNSSKQIEADFVVLAIGVKPEIKLAKDAGLEIGKTGGIAVNTKLQTSDSEIYALGDAIEVVDFVTQTPALIPLAGPANRQGRIVADNIVGIDSQYKATQGTSIVKIFDYAVATTGANEKSLKRNNIEYKKVIIHGNSHATYYPDAFALMIKLLFSPTDGKILGAQCIGLAGVDKRIDVIATALKFEKTVDDLVELELSYAPPFGSAKDPVNMAGMAAQNIIKGRLKTIDIDEMLDLKEDYMILDVRTAIERSVGKIENSVHIPLEELRERFNELPRDKKIIVHCTRGLKSYFASRILMQKGFDNVYSLNGGYLLYKQLFFKARPKTNQLTQPVSEISVSVKVDACAMQCPGPIMRLADSMKDLSQGQVVEIKSSDPGFKMDIESWCNSTGNKVLNITNENKIIKAYVQKGANAVMENKMIETTNGQTMIVFSNDLDKVMAAFIIANGAAAAGKDVTMFFTFWGINALRKSTSQKVNKNLIEKMFGFMMPKGVDKLTLSKMNMFGMGSLMMKHVMKSKNVPTLPELIEMSKKNGIKIIACNMAMEVMGIKQEELIDGIQIGGVAAYIDESSKANSNLFI